MNEEKREETMMFSQEGTENPKLNSKDLLLSLAAILVSACILSGAIPSAFVGLASLALFVYAVIAIRNAGAIIQLVLSALIATVLTFLPICGAAVLALVIGTGVLAWLFMTLPKFKWAPVSLLVVAYALGFLVSADVITPLLALAFLPAAALMAWAHARDLGRTATVLHTFLGFLVTVLATLCVLLLRTYGAVNYDVLMTFVADLKSIFVTIGTEAGKIYFIEGDEKFDLAPDTLVSMNLWGFTPSYIEECNARFASFLEENLPKNPEKCEFFLPTVVANLISEGKADVKVLDNSDKWYGVTYKEDKENVVAAFRELKAQGVYPENF
jgi:hypothetical protein